jgi:K+-sensing histidine kinase KdpD
MRSDEAILELRETIAKLELLRARQQQQVLEFESDNRRFFAEYAEVEQQNSNLANLYVASYRLHGTLERKDVLEAIHEIIINLVGSEELAVFELDAARNELKLLSSFGIDETRYATLPLDDSAIARSVQTGEMFLHEPPPNSSSSPVSSLTTCVPLKLGEQVIGVIAVFRMLPQKPQLVSVDRELFALLGTHAAIALHCSGLHARLRELT